MNDLSNGSLLGRVLSIRGTSVALFGGFAAALAGCPGPAPQSGTGGSGGETSTSSTTSTTSTTSSSTSSSSTGGMPCTTLSDCPAPDSACRLVTCKDNTCVVEHAAANTACSDGGSRCDGAGSCVECISHDECVDPADSPCTGVKYQAPPTCSGGKCVPGDIKDCEAEGLKCTDAGCAECAVDTDCGTSPLGMCTMPACSNGTCGTAKLPQATPCSIPQDGTCNATGECKLGKYVFVTKGDFTADLGGVMGADHKCQTAAMMANLAGDWVAWTSDDQSKPTDRLGLMIGSLTPYRRLDDSPVTVGLAGLTSTVSTAFQHGIDWTEAGTSVSSEHVWTGTKPTGGPSGASCGGWMPGAVPTSVGTYGVAGATDGTWTRLMEKACDNTAKGHLYCFQK